MKRKTNKKITMEDLAGMIKRGFDENTKWHRKIRKILEIPLAIHKK